MQDYSGIQVGANVHVSDLTYVDGTVQLNNNNSNNNNNDYKGNNREMIKAIDTVSPQFACVLPHGRPSRCQQSVLLGGEPLETCGLNVLRNRPGHRRDQNQGYSGSSHILSFAILPRVTAWTKIMISHGLILLQGRVKWPVRPANVNVLARFARVRCKVYVFNVKLRCHLRFTCIPAHIVQKRTPFVWLRCEVYTWLTNYNAVLNFF